MDLKDVLLNFATISILQGFVCLLLALQLNGNFNGDYRKVFWTSLANSVAVTVLWGIQLIPYGFLVFANLLTCAAIIRMVILPKWKDAFLIALLLFVPSAIYESLVIFTASYLNIDVLQFPNRILFGLSESLLIGLAAYAAIKNGFELKHKNQTQRKKMEFALFLALAIPYFFLYQLDIYGFQKSSWIVGLASSVLGGAIVYISSLRKLEAEQEGFEKIFEEVIMQEAWEEYRDAGHEEMAHLSEKLLLAFIISWHAGRPEIPEAIEKLAKSDDISDNDIFWYFWFYVKGYSEKSHKFLCSWIDKNGIILRRSYGKDEIKVYNHVTGEVEKTISKGVETCCNES